MPTADSTSAVSANNPSTHIVKRDSEVCPATRSSMPVDLAIHGMTTIMGTATISTSEVT
jgi:hypothetical protein